MYNGIGLDTARGSGTNGYVQRNLSFIKRQKDRIDYTSEEQLKKLDAQFKEPNPEILLHEKKRKIEVKCLEMKELMEEQGYTEEEINNKLTLYRGLLTEKNVQAEQGIELDEFGRPMAKATHQLAEASTARNEMLKQAFGISEYFKEGTSLDPERKVKEKAARELTQKKYSLIPDESSDEEEAKKSTEKKKDKKKIPTLSKSNDEEEKEKEGKKKRKRLRSSSEPPSDNDEKGRKRQKQDGGRERQKQDGGRERQKQDGGRERQKQDGGRERQKQDRGRERQKQDKDMEKQKQRTPSLSSEEEERARKKEKRHKSNKDRKRQRD